MKKLSLVLLLVAWGSIVSAQQTGTVHLSWTNATKNEDNTVIPINDHGSLAYTTIKYSVCVNGDVDLANAKIHYVSATKTSTTISTQGPPGDYCFRATHTNSFGVESALSNLSIKTVTSSGEVRDYTTPQAPQTLVVSDPTVYTIIKQENKFVLLPVGTVPANTVCIADQKINGYYAVPINVVSWSGTVRPVIVVAQCS